MSRRTKALIAVGVLLAFGGIVAWQWQRILSAYSVYYVRTVTTDLPRCDRVEVFHLDGNAFNDGSQYLQPSERFHTDAYGGGEDKVLGHVTLQDADAEAFARLWRTQKFDWGLQKLCHSPVCGLRFYSGRKLMFQTTVCFQCSDFYVTIPFAGTAWWGFDAESPAAVNLIQRLWILFPDSKPKAK